MHTFLRVPRSLSGFVLGILFLLAVYIGLPSCHDSGTPRGPGDGGASSDGGCPVRLPEPQFVLEISAEDGFVPKDLRVTAQWSAADEPPFVLSDPTTWKTLDEGVNLMCIVDRNKPPPEDLMVLKCELWTSGAVNVFVQATGYVSYEDTLTPLMNEVCGEPMSQTLPIVLRRPPLDAGPLP